MYGYGMSPFYFDWTMILIIPGMLLAALASYWVKSAYAKYGQIPAKCGLTAAQVAQQLLQQNNCGNVTVDQIAGSLTDNYDPRNQSLHLSQTVYGSSSIAALGVAAHECGHAMQHEGEYGPLMLRSFIVPAVNITSGAAMPLFFAGLLFSWQPLVTIGILCFAVAVFFSLVTLPVELNASRRALVALESTGYLTPEENEGAKKVLRAAAMTYVASALTAILQLARLLLISNSNRRRD